VDITVPIKDLTAQLANAKRVVGRTTTLPCLRGVRLVASGGTLTLQTTDLAVTLTSSLPATVRSEGMAVVPVAELAKHVKGKGSIDLTLIGEALRTVNGTTSSLRVLPAEEWPRDIAPDFTNAPTYPLDLAAIVGIAVAASTDPSKPHLSGVYFDGAEIVATDSYRLHILRSAEVSYPQVLVPARAILLAAKAGSTGTLQVVATVRQQGRDEITDVHARITVGNQVIDVQQPDGTYPNYRQLIPSGYPCTITVDRLQLLAVVQSVKPMAQYASPIRLTVEGDQLVISARTQDVGEATGSVPAKVEGEFPMVVAFNPEFLAECLSTMTDERATLGVLDGLKPALFDEQTYRWETRPGTRGRKTTKVGTLVGSNLRLIMPVRVS
jgi:DNA polymerase III subunit beta